MYIFKIIFIYKKRFSQIDYSFEKYRFSIAPLLKPLFMIFMMKLIAVSFLLIASIQSTYCQETKDYCKRGDKFVIIQTLLNYKVFIEDNANKNRFTQIEISKN